MANQPDYRGTVMRQRCAVFAGLWAGLAGASATAAPPGLVLLLREGDTTPSGAVARIRDCTINGVGGHAATIIVEDAASGLHAVWGSRFPSATGTLLAVEGSSAGIRQMSFEDAGLGLADNGSVSFSAFLDRGDCASSAYSHGYRDSVWSGTTPLAVQDEPLGTRLWNSLTQVNCTPGGRVFWLGESGLPGQPPDVTGLYYWAPAGPVLVFSKGASVLQPTGSANLSVAFVRTASLVPTGNSGFGIVRLSGASATTDEAMVQSSTSSNKVVRVLGAGQWIREGSPVQGGIGGESWRQLGLLATPGSGTNVLFAMSGVTSGTANRNEIVVSGSSTSSPVVFREGDAYSGQIVAGPIEHVAMNGKGSVVVGARIAGGTQEALFLDRTMLIRQGDRVPLERVPPGQQPRLGTLTNFLGVNTVAVSANGAVARNVTSVYFIVNVQPDANDYDPGIVYDDRIECMYRIDIVTPLQAIATEPFALGEFYVFLNGWLAGDAASDFDGSGGPPDQTDLTLFFDEWMQRRQDR